MKQFLLGVVLSLCTTTFYAQDADQPAFLKHEIGLNMTSFVENIISFSGSIENTSPYLLTYKYHFPKHALRFGIGGAYSTSSLDVDNDPIDTRNIDADLSFRLGIERQYVLNPRWVTYLGGDLVYFFDQIKATADSDFDKVVTNRTVGSYGGGLVLGAQFNITPRLNISTESSIHIFYREENEKITSEEFPDLFNESTKKTDTAFEIIVPVAIFLKFRL